MPQGAVPSEAFITPEVAMHMPYEGKYIQRCDRYNGNDVRRCSDNIHQAVRYDQRVDNLNARQTETSTVSVARSSGR